MNLFPELAKIVSDYSKPWMPCWREYNLYCKTVHFSEWPELKEMLKVGHQDTIDALLGYFSETDPEKGTFGIVLYRKTLWVHDLAKAVYGEHVVWWKFPAYPVWLSAQIVRSRGAGRFIRHPGWDVDSPYQEEFDEPIFKEFTLDWANKHDETHEDFVRYYQV